MYGLNSNGGIKDRHKNRIGDRKFAASAYRIRLCATSRTKFKMSEG